MECGEGIIKVGDSASGFNFFPLLGCATRKLKILPSWGVRLRRMLCPYTEKPKKAA